MSKAMGDTLGRLEAVIHDRLAAGEAEASYVASLAAEGRSRSAPKLREVAVDAGIAAVSEDDPELIGEASDLVFHLSILLADRGLTWDMIAAELGRRHGTSGHAEKASRQP